MRIVPAYVRQRSREYSIDICRVKISTQILEILLNIA